MMGEGLMPRILYSGIQFLERKMIVQSEDNEIRFVINQLTESKGEASSPRELDDIVAACQKRNIKAHVVREGDVATVKRLLID